MLYTYEKHRPAASGGTERYDTTTNIDEIVEENVTHGRHVQVTNNRTGEGFQMRSLDDLHGQRVTEERNRAWACGYDKEKHKWDPFDPIETEIRMTSAASELDLSADDPVSPEHYKNFFEDKQWIEYMQSLPTYAGNRANMAAALEWQVRNYLDRRGRKAESPKDLEKALWYLKFWVAYERAGRNILVEEVDKILGGT
jgi:hypothetical protein